VATALFTDEVTVMVTDCAEESPIRVAVLDRMGHEMLTKGSADAVLAPLLPPHPIRAITPRTIKNQRTDILVKDNSSVIEKFPLPPHF
jgi:hypothetical protein